MIYFQHKKKSSTIQFRKCSENLLFVIRKKKFFHPTCFQIYEKAKYECMRIVFQKNMVYNHKKL